MTLTHLTLPLAVLALTAGCTPTIKIQAPDKPIEINLNVHIDQEVRVKVDNELNSAFKDHPELFGPAGEQAAGQPVGGKAAQ